MKRFAFDEVDLETGQFGSSQAIRLSREPLSQIAQIHECDSAWVGNRISPKYDENCQACYFVYDDDRAMATRYCRVVDEDSMEVCCR